MLVVADTSPLNYLVWIESVEILPRLYSNVVIPPEVRDELLANDAPAIVQAWASALPAWIEVCAPDPAYLDDARWQALHVGERAALALAMARQSSVLLIDERAGSEVARALGLSTTGTLGVLDEAARRNLVSLPEALARLKQTSFRYPRLIVERLLKEDARRRSGR
jgi:predicted nucleic acid-binding protein